MKFGKGPPAQQKGPGLSSVSAAELFGEHGRRADETSTPRHALSRTRARMVKIRRKGGKGLGIGIGMLHQVFSATWGATLLRAGLGNGSGQGGAAKVPPQIPAMLNP